MINGAIKFPQVRLIDAEGQMVGVVSIEEALKSAYQASIRTILTSGLIMIFITWILGYVFADPSIGQICHIISIGVTCALVMILCFLPGMLAVCD